MKVAHPEDNPEAQVRRAVQYPVLHWVRRRSSANITPGSNAFLVPERSCPPPWPCPPLPVLSKVGGVLLLDRLVSHPSKTGDFQRLLQPQPGSGAGWEGVRWSSCSRLWLLVAFDGYGPNSRPSALPLLARPSLLWTHTTTSNFSSSRGEPASCRSLAEDLEPPGDTPRWEPFPSLSLLLLPLCAAVVGSGSLCKGSV